MVIPNAAKRSFGETLGNVGLLQRTAASGAPQITAVIWGLKTSRSESSARERFGTDCCFRFGQILAGGKHLDCARLVAGADD